MSSKNNPPNLERLIRVAVARPVYGTFGYRVPDYMAFPLAVGVRVLVPFRNQVTVGYVLGTEKEAVGYAPKEIRDVLDKAPLFPGEQVVFFEWIADYYHHPIGDVIQQALPGGLNPKTGTLWELTSTGREAIASLPTESLDQRLLVVIKDAPATARSIRQQLDNAAIEGPLRRLQGAGLIDRVYPAPKGLQPRTEQLVRLAAKSPQSPMLSAIKRAILDYLETHPSVSVSALKEITPYATRHVKDLLKKGLVEVEAVPVWQDALGQTILPESPPVLTPDQQQAVAAITQAFGSGYRTLLLAGVTGSGKTEVYLRAAAHALEMGKTVLILVPEIALLSQMEGRFRARFGPRVALLHSALTQRERYDHWLRIADGQTPIVIGARSAIFAPLRNLGLMIVDEEHDMSYKQEHGLRYNARDLAVVRANMNACMAVLGSATPEIQSWHNVRNGKYHLIRLPNRVGNRPLPRIEIVDLRKVRDLRGVRRFLTPSLIDAMKTTLAVGQQVLLFLNRRGYANLPVCAWCGAPVRCKHCDINLTLHRHSNAFACHYCGFTRPATTRCEACGSDELRLLGLGTEKVVEAVQALFPEARVARMDRDTTRRKGALVKMLGDLRHRRTDVLVGTQMVAKGHDFPGITLVGIICADLSMNFPDFRAEERTFQLVAQVAGRAGRGQHAGKVILQTYNPEQITLLTAQQQDFEKFYAHDIHQRQMLGYPPFTRLIRLVVAGPDEQATARHAQRVGHLCRQRVAAENVFTAAVGVLGPVESSLFRVAGRYRWQMLLKSSQPALLRRFLAAFLADPQAQRTPRGVSLQWDVDPYTVM